MEFATILLFGLIFIILDNFLKRKNLHSLVPHEKETQAESKMTNDMLKNNINEKVPQKSKMEETIKKMHTKKVLQKETQKKEVKINLDTDSFNVLDTIVMNEILNKPKALRRRTFKNFF